LAETLWSRPTVRIGAPTKGLQRFEAVAVNAAPRVVRRPLPPLASFERGTRDWVSTMCTALRQ
jgi:hypothetical protein